MRSCGDMMPTEDDIETPKTSATGHILCCSIGQKRGASMCRTRGRRAPDCQASTQLLALNQESGVDSTTPIAMIDDPIVP